MDNTTYELIDINNSQSGWALHPNGEVYSNDGDGIYRFSENNELYGIDSDTPYLKLGSPQGDGSITPVMSSAFIAYTGSDVKCAEIHGDNILVLGTYTDQNGEDIVDSLDLEDDYLILKERYLSDPSRLKASEKKMLIKPSLPLGKDERVRLLLILAAFHEPCHTLTFSSGS